MTATIKKTNTELNLHIKINLPDWCWSEPDSDGTRYGLKTPQARMARSLRDLIRSNITEALKAQGAESYHGSGGLFDLDLSNCPLSPYQITQCIAKAIGGFKDIQNCWGSWSFDYPPELVTIQFAEYDHKLKLDEILSLKNEYKKLSDCLLIRD